MRSTLLLLTMIATTVPAAAFALGQGLIITGCSSSVYDSAGNCIDNPSPAQRAAHEQRFRAEQQRREQEQRAREARQAEFQRQVEIQVARLGAHRRAEAERYARMWQEAKEARERNQPDFRNCWVRPRPAACGPEPSGRPAGVTPQ